MGRTGETDTHPAPIGARSAVTFELGVAPVDIEVERATYAGAQVAVSGRQTAVGGGSTRAGRAGGRIASPARERACREAQQAQEGEAQPQHALQCTARRVTRP